MLKSLLHRLRVRRTPPAAVPAIHAQKATVEEIWKTWRFEKPGSGTPTRKPSFDSPIRKPGPSPTIRKNFRFEPKTSSNRVQNRPATVAERVAQLQRLGEYEKALGLALLEIAREEEQQRSMSGERQAVPWYYWEAAIILRRLKRFDDEMALIRRFARNHDIHFRSFSRRHRSMPSARDAWAANFLGRLEDARTAAEKRAREAKL